MTTDEFIKHLAEKLIHNFPDITNIEYEFRENAGVHFLRITPQAVLKSEKFARFDSEITTDFYEKNFPGMICFLTDDSLIKLNSPQTLFKNMVSLSFNDLSASQSSYFLSFDKHYSLTHPINFQLTGTVENIFNGSPIIGSDGIIVEVGNKYNAQQYEYETNPLKEAA